MHEQLKQNAGGIPDVTHSSRASVAPRVRRSIGSAATGAVIVESGITCSYQIKRAPGSTHLRTDYFQMSMTLWRDPRVHLSEFGVRLLAYSSAMHMHVEVHTPWVTIGCESSRASVAPRARRSIGSAATGAAIVESGIWFSKQDSRAVRCANDNRLHLYVTN
jgi:hypothetical protein